MRFLLDTNAVGEPVRRQPSRRFLAQIERFGTVIAIGAPTLAELRFGIARMPPSARRADIASYYDGLEAEVPILPFDADAAHWHATKRAELVAAGATPPWVDLEIAAIAATRGLILVTANVRDFEPFGVDLMDWTAP